MKMQKAAGMAGPSSSIGIMRFFDTDTGGPKLTPEFVLIVTLVFVIIVLALHAMS